jgi:hypothetical protein
MMWSGQSKSLEQMKKLVLQMGLMFESGLGTLLGAQSEWVHSFGLGQPKM